MERPIVTLTTDFGLTDPSVGLCKGVILGIAPDVQIVDISHGVTRHSIFEGANLLADTLPFFPVGIHVAVIDPGVGTQRRPIGIATRRGDILVGPDNGLLTIAASRLGGVVACHELANEAYRRERVSLTFHGRDLFAPAAGHLARGVPLASFGPAIDPASLVEVDVPHATVFATGLEAPVVSVDSFGSAQLAAGADDLERAVGWLEYGTPLAITLTRSASPLEVAHLRAVWHRTYGEAAGEELVVLLDSYGRVALAVNLGSAAEAFDMGVGDFVRIERE